ncbi:MAG: hypothetical protein ACPL28_11015 [bacterium]
MKGKKNKEKVSRNDYIYRYEINVKSHNSVYSDPIIEVIKENLEAILEVVILTCDGKEVSVNGFKLLDGDEIYSLFH